MTVVIRPRSQSYYKQPIKKTYNFLNKVQNKRGPPKKQPIKVENYSQSQRKGNYERKMAKVIQKDISKFIG